MAFTPSDPADPDFGDPEPSPPPPFGMSHLLEPALSLPGDADRPPQFDEPFGSPRRAFGDGVGPPPGQTASNTMDLPSFPPAAMRAPRKPRGSSKTALVVIGVAAAAAGGVMAWAVAGQGEQPSRPGPAETPRATLASAAPATTPTGVPSPSTTPTTGPASPTDRPSAKAEPTGSGRESGDSRPSPGPKRSSGGSGGSGGGGHRTSPPSHHANPPHTTKPKPKPTQRLCPVYDNGVLVAYRPC